MHTAALCREFIQARCVKHRVAVRAQVTPTLIVGHDDHHVGKRCSLGLGIRLTTRRQQSESGEGGGEIRGAHAVSLGPE